MTLCGSGVSRPLKLLALSACVKEALINSGWSDMRSKMFSCKAQIAGNSRPIGKICNAAAGYFELIAPSHELIRASLCYLTTSFDSLDTR